MRQRSRASVYTVLTSAAYNTSIPEATKAVIVFVSYCVDNSSPKSFFSNCRAYFPTFCHAISSIRVPP